MTDQKQLHFLADTNLGLPIDDSDWAGALRQADVEVSSTTDVEQMVTSLQQHGPDMSYVPAGAFWRVVGKGDTEYRGLAINSSKRTASTNLKSLLVVRTDDPAASIADLRGQKLAFFNHSCSSTYFPPAMLLAPMQEKPADYFDLVRVKADFTWESLLKALLSGEVRATMVLQDVWETFPELAVHLKVIGSYHYTAGGVFMVRSSLTDSVTDVVLEALLTTVPPWKAVYGGFLPYHPALLRSFFHDLDTLPADV